MNSDISITPRQSLFFGIKNINSPLDKKYRILPYSQQIIKNENNIFDLIYFKGNQKRFNQLKNTYIEERNKIRKEYFTQKQKEKIFKSSNIININTYDEEKINIHSPISVMEGNFMSNLIQYCKNKKKRIQKLIEYKKKNKFVFKIKRPSLTQNLFFNNNRSKIKNRKGLFELLKNLSEENKIISNNSLTNSINNSEKNNNENFSSINNILIEDDSLSPSKNNEFRKTINTIFSKTYNKLNKDKKSLSANNFFGIQNKKIKLIGTKEQKMDLKHKKLSKLFFSKVFKEENNIVKKLNEINNDLLDFKYNSHYFDNETDNIFTTPKRKNNYKRINENLTSLHKQLYEFPETNEYIYGSRNPTTIFSKSKIKPKIETNLPE